MNQWPDATATLPEDGTEGPSSAGSGDPVSARPSSPSATAVSTT